VMMNKNVRKGPKVTQRRWNICEMCV
jgi:hypothetical protein